MEGQRRALSLRVLPELDDVPADEPTTIEAAREVLCTRLARFRQSGHWSGQAVDTASTTRMPEDSVTRPTEPVSSCLGRVRALVSEEV
ncbi:hypothetical protein Scel_00800 [Streptomyces cellostaticus]|nr:hypothetical protein Scel_00800 [Streptomyces cellostaticus]